MVFIASLLIGGSCSVLVRRHMKQRYYGPVDDMIWGVLGALLGASIADLLGLTNYGIIITFLAMGQSAVMVLLVTGLIHDVPVGRRQHNII